MKRRNQPAWIRSWMWVVLLGMPLSQARAQVNTGNISGVVTDPSGAVVPQAQITARNTATGITQRAVSNGQGQYTFAALPIGNYEITIVHTGFEKELREGVNVAAAQSVSLNVALPVSSAQQTVTINGGAPLVDAANAQQLQTTTTRQIQQLPLPKNDWTTLLTQGAGVTPQSPTTTTGIGLALNGLPPAGFNITVDGTDASSNPEGPSLGFYQSPNVINTVNTDAIAEVSVVKGIAPATIGATLSGNVNVITKSGSNHFHGTLFETNDTDAFDARNWFLTQRPRSTLNEFGGSLGGPILRDKLFFFTSLENVRLSALAAINANVPTPYLISISPAVYQPIFAVFPSVPQGPTPTSLTALYNTASSTINNDENDIVRLDYAVNPSNLVNIRYTRGRPQKTAPRIPSIDPRVTQGHSDQLNSQWIYSNPMGWSATTRVGWNRLVLDRVDEGIASDLEEITYNFDSDGAEDFEIRGDTYSGEENIAFTKGRHSFQVGGIVSRDSDGRHDYNTTSLKYSSLSDFQANIPSSVVINFDLTPFRLYSSQYGVFIQDDWKLRPNLTVNLGLRWDYFTVPDERNGRVFNRGVDPNNPSLGYGFGPFRPADSMYNADYHNFGPRAGFSWSPYKNEGMVVRGGAGMFASPHPIYGGPIEEVNDAANIPDRITLDRAQALQAGLKYPIPRNTYAQVVANLQSNGTLAADLPNTTIDPNFPNPYSLQWMLGVEQQIPGQVVAELDYIANHGVHENLTETFNLPNRLTGVAPVPNFGNFRAYLAGDESKYESLQASLTKRFSHSLSFQANYTWAQDLSLEGADLLLQANPQDNSNIHADYGPTPFAIRDSFNANGLYETPKLAQMNHLVRSTLGDWQISGTFQANDGTPLNVTNGASSYPADRPDASGHAYTLPNWRTTRQYINPAAFTAVPIITASGAQARPGNLGRDAFYGPGESIFDATLGKTFAIRNKYNFQLRGDFLNALNHPVFSGVVTDTSKSTFGQTTVASNRMIQVTAKIRF